MSILYTIGYEGRSIAEFLSLLKNNNIKAVVDVRKKPTSLRKQFSKTSIEKRLTEENIAYVSIPELGMDENVKQAYLLGYLSHTCFKQYYNMIMDKYLGSLIQVVDRYKNEGNVAIMCKERYAKPSEYQRIYCHRYFLAERLLMLEVVSKVVDL